MSGLRAPFAVFLLLTLLPAGVLAYLGWRATSPLVDTLQRALADDLRRTVDQAVLDLPRRLHEHEERIAAALAREAATIAASLPGAEPGAVLAAVTRRLGTVPRIVRASGDAIVPAAEQALRLEHLPEWSRFEEWRRRAARMAAVPVPQFAAPALAAWAIAAAEPDDDAAVQSLAAVPPMGLVAAGPLPCERLARTAAGRTVLRRGADDGWLLSVPATTAARRHWLEIAAADAALLEGLRRAERAENGPSRAFRADLPGGAGLELRCACRDLVDALGAVEAGDCTVVCAASAGPIAFAFDDVDRAHCAAATEWGAIDVRARHRGLAAAIAASTRQRWLTGAGIALLLFVLGSGVWLARRALVHERRARRLRDDFIANVSHELKTPLTGLRLHAELLADELSPADRRRYGDVAQAEGARLSALVDDLLDFAALERGRRRLEPEPIDLARAVRAAVESFGSRAERDGVDLRFAAEGDVQCLCDATALQRIVANLLQNAFRHGRPSRDGTRSRIVVRVGPGPVLEVRDNGPGVAAADRERIFARFETSGPRAGTGIGLSLSRELARRCGGDLVCTDDGARGETVFVLSLPDAPPCGDELAGPAEVTP